MPDIYRETRYRERDDDSSDDERRHTTIRRYKVNPPDDYRGRYSPHTTALVERERDVVPYGDLYEKEYQRERRRDNDHGFDDDRDWGHRSRDDGDLRMERRVDRNARGDVRVQRRYEEHIDRDGDGHPDVDCYRKETEYYSPYDTPARQRDQKITAQEAPPPAPVIVPRQDPNVMVLRDERSRELVRKPTRQDDEYYYRRRSKEVGPHRWEEREIERHNHRRSRDYASDGDFSDDDYVVRRRRRTVVRDRSSSPDDDHKLHLAEGALAGAGVTALINSRRDKYGDLPEHRGRKVIAGAALGALGTEAYKRARSAYGERYGRHRSPSGDRHSRLKTGLGIAAAALAVAGATQYYKSSKVEKEEARRGRSRTRSYRSDDDYYSSRSPSRTPSRKRSRSRSVAKAALATAATAGLVKHLRNRSRSKARSPSSRSRSISVKGRSRSRSRLRTGAKLAAAAVAGGTAGKLYKNHRDRKQRDRSRSSSASASFYEPRRGSPSRSRSRSRSQSRSRSATRSHLSDAGPADRELGLIEYGRGDLPPQAPPYPDDDDPRDRRRRRSRRDRSPSLGEQSESDGEKRERKRSSSRLRNMAAAAAGTGAAAMGIREHRKKQKSRERDGDNTDDRRAGGRREREKRRFEDDDLDDAPPSPPHASGGYSGHAIPHMSGANGVKDYSSYPPQTYYQMPPTEPAAPYSTGPPPEATGDAPPPPPDAPYSPSSPPEPNAYPSSPPGPAPGPQDPRYPPGPRPSNRPPPMGPDHVSRKSRRPPARDARSATASHDDDVRPSSIWNRFKRHMRPPSDVSDDENTEQLRRESVGFAPLSPNSSKALRQHRRHRSRSPRRARTEDFHDSKPIAERRRQSMGPPVSRRKASEEDPDSESDVEYLPDRFDSRGRPLSAAEPGAGWTTRNGQFRRKPRHASDWDVGGMWHVGGTDKEMVERMAENLRDVVDGRMSWLGLMSSMMDGLEDGRGRKRPVRGSRRDGRLSWKDLTR